MYRTSRNMKERDNMSNLVQRLLGRIDYDDVMSMKEARNLEGLIKALNYRKEAPVRAWAAHALVDLNEPLAYEHLITFLSNEADPDCIGSLYYLVKLANTQIVVDACLERIEKTETGPEVRRILISMLGELKDRRASEKLIPLLKAEMSVSWSSSLQADWQTRTLVAQALGNIGDPRAVEPLIILLNPEGFIAWWSSPQDNWTARAAAAEALGKIGDPKAVQALVQVRGGLYHEKPSHYETQIERAANTALLLLGPSALKRLIALTNDPLLAASALDIIHKILLSSIGSTQSQDLEEIVKLSSISQNWQDSWSGDEEYKTYSGTDEIDCSPVRELAEQELKRRNPKIMQ